jgi:L-lactate dehydrogenase complex protein LldE
MADRKLDTTPEVDWVVSGDPGCLLHLEGRSRARGRSTGFRPLASVLWEGVDGRP